MKCTVFFFPVDDSPEPNLCRVLNKKLFSASHDIIRDLSFFCCDIFIKLKSLQILSKVSIFDKASLVRVDKETVSISRCLPL